MATTILATVTAKPECTADVEIALRNMIPVTRAETGCISYLLFRSDEQAGVFQLLESYADDAALASHQQSAHFAELVASLTEKLAGDIHIARITALDA